MIEPETRRPGSLLMRPALFQRGRFPLASGGTSTWKIECNALTSGDWETLAKLAVQRLPAFSEVRGVPRGGLPFARALSIYRYPPADRVLVVDDVWTTGGSIRRFLVREELPDPPGTLIVVAFSRIDRSGLPLGVRAVFAGEDMG